MNKVLKLLFIVSLLLSSLGCNEEYMRWVREQLAQRNQELNRESLSSLFGKNLTDEELALLGLNQFQDPNYTEATLTRETSAEDALLYGNENACPSLIDTTPRGLACLHCNEQGARAQSNTLVDLMYRSCLKNVAINYLVDGTFSFDEDLLKKHIDRLTSGDRKLFLFFYLSNGATQRKYDSTNIDAFGVRISPEEFRERIFSDAGLQYDYQKIVRRLVPVIAYAKSKNANVYLIPALEDNLTIKSFTKLYELTKEAVPSTLQVAYGRNACPGCYSGNDNTTPDGLFREIHTSSPFPHAEDSFITNDGRDYCYGDCQSGDISLDDLHAVRDNTAGQKSVFILWDAERQGLPKNLRGARKHPSERSYQSPSPAEEQAIIGFLRGN